jgi:8-oxo-dGTP diphosphatase
VSKSLTPEDQEFLANYSPDDFAHPSLTVDVVVATVKDGALYGLLIKRSAAPERGRYALPGGFVALDESLEDATTRVLRDKVGLTDVYLEQLYTFGALGRDPRHRVVTVTYLALVPVALLATLPSDVTLARLDVSWKGETGGPAQALRVTFADSSPLPLAFDHADILGLAVKRLRGKLNYSPVGYELLNQEFALRDLQAIHESILGHKLNKDSFRRTIIDRGQVEPTGQFEKDVKWRPAELYRFARPPQSLEPKS